MKDKIRPEVWVDKTITLNRLETQHQIQLSSSYLYNLTPTHLSIDNRIGNQLLLLNLSSSFGKRDRRRHCWGVLRSFPTNIRIFNWSFLVGKIKQTCDHEETTPSWGQQPPSLLDQSDDWSSKRIFLWTFIEFFYCWK